MKLFIFILMWWTPVNQDENVRSCASIVVVHENFNSALVLAQAAYVMQGEGNTDKLVHIAASQVPIPTDDHGDSETPHIVRYTEHTPCGEETDDG